MRGLWLEALSILLPSLWRRKRSAGGASNFKTKEVNGVVLSAENKQLPGNTRRTWIVQCKFWFCQDDQKLAELKKQNIRPGLSAQSFIPVELWDDVAPAADPLPNNQPILLLFNQSNLLMMHRILLPPRCNQPSSTQRRQRRWRFQLPPVIKGTGSHATAIYLWPPLFQKGNGLLELGLVKLYIQIQVLCERWRTDWSTSSSCFRRHNWSNWWNLQTLNCQMMSQPRHLERWWNSLALFFWWLALRLQIAESCGRQPRFRNTYLHQSLGKQVWQGTELSKRRCWESATGDSPTKGHSSLLSNLWIHWLTQSQTSRWSWHWEDSQDTFLGQARQSNGIWHVCRGRFPCLRSMHSIRWILKWLLFWFGWRKDRLFFKIKEKI